ncbi:hypothetical protein SAMN05428975_2389 [Mucilaginibacter sp. OK268]|nr:hypothetical protein SAMN05428975_2389 [Mucilaginibacter sp. OK268]
MSEINRYYQPAMQKAFLQKVLFIRGEIFIDNVIIVNE